VRLWNTADPAAPTALGAPLTGHTDGVTSVAFAPDGHTVASAGADGTVRLWNTADPAAPTALGAPLTGHTDRVWSVAFAPDGHTLASGGADGTVRLWNLTGLIELRAHVIERACSITDGGLSRSEWGSYVSVLKYVDVCKT
jgi:WD40 repeat protein